MTELSRYVGPDTDVPAGDIGVGECSRWTGGRLMGIVVHIWCLRVSKTGAVEVWHDCF